MESLRCRWLTSVQAVGVLFLCAGIVHATEYTWDNWTGDSSFQTALNWSPVAVPGSLDIATFDGLLGGSGVGNNAVNVAHNTAVQVMKVIDTAVVDMTIGDGTSASVFFLTQNTGDSLLIGDSSGDTATLNHKGGWLDTWQTSVGGRAGFNITGAGTVWDSTTVLISGDTVANTAGIGVGLSANVDSSGFNVDVGSDTGSGRIVVDGTPQVLFGPSAAWGGIGTLDVGPTGTTGSNFGQVTLQAGGQMNAISASVHGTSTTASKITVKTGGDLAVSGLLQIGPYGTLELMDNTSSVATGQLASTGGSFNWTGGTLAINGEAVFIESTAGHSVLGSNLTIGAGKRLEVNYSDGYARSLEIGDLGNGTLTIQNGGQVQSNRGTIGGTGAGTVSVDGGGSRWDAADIRVGEQQSATGTLNILNGGQVTGHTFMDIGFVDAARGSVTVSGVASGSGSPSLLDVNGNVNVGSSTGTSSLTVSDGGRVEVANTLKVWEHGTVTVNSPSVIVADQVDLGAGATFNLNSGAALYTNQLIGFGNNPVFGGNLLFGQADGASAAGYSVGSGQSLTTGKNLVIGVDKSASLIVSDSGYVDSLNGLIGATAGSDGSMVSLNGSGSGWRIHGSLNIGGDGYTVGGESSLLIQNDAVVDADGWVTVWPDSSIVLNLGVLEAMNVELAGGDLFGGGLVILGSGTLYNSGRVYPYGGVIDVVGTYSQTSVGEMDSILYGHGGVPGVDFLQLNVTDSADLNGLLSVYYHASFTPVIGDAFRILAASAGVTGRYDLVLLPDFGSLGLRVDYSDPYSVYIRAGLAGDLNGDGFVGLDDLDIVLRRWNQNATAGVWDQGDPSGDGYVGLADLDIILNHWNAGTPPSVSDVIPEPSVFVLLVGAAGMLIAQRRMG